MESQLKKNPTAAFVPMLYMENLKAAMEFYKNAFDAIEMRHVSNSDDTVHVAEMYIGDALFRMHQETSNSRQLSPFTVSGTTVVIGLLVDDPDSTFKKAIAAGAEEVHPMQTYDYGYRQGTLRDPFGHHWMIEKNSFV